MANSVVASCAVPGCERARLALGLCNAHYLRQRKGVPMLRPVEPRDGTRVCSVTDCASLTNPHGGRGMCRTHYRRWVRKSRTERLVSMLGGKCKGCGQSFDSVVFDFHHRDPEDKSFGISQEIENRPLVELEAEAKKCDLMCANCHRIHHFGKGEEHGKF